MRQQTRSRIADGLDRTRLLGPAERVRAGWLTLRAGEVPILAPDGAPLPPPRLRLLVDGRTGDAKRSCEWAPRCAARSRRRLPRRVRRSSA